MNIVEHNDNIVIKEKTNVQQYLMRIIQRYFDNEYVETRNSIEAIVVEALTRVKRELLHEQSFVFSINGKTGKVKISIEDLHGEPLFNKRTAFNKDFCSYGSSIPDTICRGDDPRLKDKRVSFPHNHQGYESLIDDTGTSLKDLLDQAETSVDIPIHVHHNLESTLNKLTYSGDKPEVDLRYFELLKQALMSDLDGADNLENILNKRLVQEMQSFTNAKKESHGYLQYSNGLSKTPPAWYDNAIEHTKIKVKAIESYCNSKIERTATQDELTEFKEDVKKYLHVALQADDIQISEGSVSTYGRTAIMKVVIPIEIPEESKSIQRIDAYLKYDIELDTDGVQTITVPIPYICGESDGSYTNIHCTWNDKSGSIEVTTIAIRPIEMNESDEFAPSPLGSYYNNPRISYKVYVGEGKDETVSEPT